MEQFLHQAQVPVPRRIRKAALQALHDDGQLIERAGAGPGSLTDDGLRYMVVDGEILRDRHPELDAWARDRIPDYASEIVGQRLEVSSHVRAAVNVNGLHGQGEQYESHVDSVPLTALLFLSGPHEGGEFVYDFEGMGRVEPIPGLLVVFTGSSVPHGVLPMRDDGWRVSMPVSLVPEGTVEERPDDLDSHLYATEGGEMRETEEPTGPEPAPDPAPEPEPGEPDEPAE